MAKKVKKRKVAYRKKMQNGFGMTLVGMIILVLIVGVGIKSFQLLQDREELLEKKAENELLIQKEEQRALEIEEYGKYTQTMKFYEETAKQRLGLVYEDEIIFIQED